MWTVQVQKFATKQDHRRHVENSIAFLAFLILSQEISRIFMNILEYGLWNEGLLCVDCSRLVEAAVSLPNVIL